MVIFLSLLYYVILPLPFTEVDFSFLKPFVVMSNQSIIKGAILAVLSCFLWGSVFIFARYLLGSPQKIDPYSLVFFRFSIASTILFIYARCKRQPLLPKSWKQFSGMVTTGIFLYWLMSMLFFIGQRTVTAMTSSLFIESGPAIILILWKIISRQKTTKAELVACVLGFIGSMFVLNIISPKGLHLYGNPWGILCVFMAAVSWVIGGYFGKDLMKTGPRITAVAWCMLICALLELPVLAVMHKSLIFPNSPSAWWAILGMAVFPTAIAFMTWGEAMALLPLWQLNLTQNLTPVFTLIGSYFILHEQLTVWNVFGIAIVLLGLSAAALNSRKTS